MGDTLALPDDETHSSCREYISPLLFDPVEAGACAIMYDNRVVTLPPLIGIDDLQQTLVNEQLISH